MSREIEQPTEEDPVAEFYRWLDKMGNTMPISTEQSRVIYQKLTLTDESHN